MASKFVKAERFKSPLKLALFGPAGAGKTYTALTIAAGFGGKVAVVDTEGGSSGRYGDRFEFDVCTLAAPSAANATEAIQDATKAGYRTVILDSASHIWDGSHGLVQEEEQLEARGVPKLQAWGKVKAKSHAFSAMIMGATVNVISTFRSKETYANSKTDAGKTKLERLSDGMIADRGVGFDYDLFGQLTDRGDLIIHKTRYSELTDMVVNRPGAAFAAQLVEIVSKGTTKPAAAETVAAPPGVSDGEITAAGAIAGVKTKAALVALGPSLTALKTVLDPAAIARVTAAYNARSAEFGLCPGW